MRKKTRTLLAGACIATATVAAPASALAQVQVQRPAPADPWQTRYDAARAQMIEGHFRESETNMRTLAALARTNEERLLATAMADLAASYAEKKTEVHAEPSPPSRPRAMRSTDELSLLYASAFLYGAGTGTWFLLQTQPDTAFTATIPFAAMTALPMIAVATVDSYRPLARGVPHSISSGLYLGLGEGIWVSGLQHSRAERIKSADPNSDARWTVETTSTVLWSGATLGGLAGAVLGSSLETTPGRVSFTASTALWAGAITGLAAGGIHPDDGYRQEHAFAIGGAGYNAGIAAGLLLAGKVSPSVARVRIVDLMGLAGGLAGAGGYLSLAKSSDARVAEGIGAIGAGAGLALGWILTSGMPRETPDPAPPLAQVQPTVSPVRGGMTLGVAGEM